MTAAGPPRLVLIVEDSEGCAVTLQIAIESIPGLEPRLVASSAAALALLEQNGARVAAVITDLQLPGMSGLDLLTRLRSELRFARIPVVMISGNSDPALPAQAISLGANAFFTKPYSPSAVRRKLEQLLS